MNRQSMRALVTAAALVIAYPTHADQPRHTNLFRSENGIYELRRLAGGEWDPTTQRLKTETWGLFISRTGDVMYEISGSRIGSQSVYFVTDGSAVVAVDDYSDARWSPDTEVLSFYNKTGSVTRYRLGDVLSERQCVSSSASHFRWLLRSPRTDGNLITLTTYELVTFTFNMITGELLSRAADPRLSAGAVYVYGPVTPLGHHRYEVEVVCPLSDGSRCHQAIEFKCRNIDGGRPVSDSLHPWGADRLEKGVYYSLIIRDGACVAHERLGVNSCVCGEEPY